MLVGLLLLRSAIADSTKLFALALEDSTPRILTYVSLLFLISELLFFPKTSDDSVTSRTSSII